MKLPATDPRGCAKHPFGFPINGECNGCYAERKRKELDELEAVRMNAGNWSGQSHGAVKARKRS